MPLAKSARSPLGRGEGEGDVIDPLTFILSPSGRGGNLYLSCFIYPPALYSRLLPQEHVQLGAMLLYMAHII